MFLFKPYSVALRRRNSPTFWIKHETSWCKKARGLGVILHSQTVVLQRLGHLSGTESGKSHATIKGKIISIHLRTYTSTFTDLCSLFNSCWMHMHRSVIYINMCIVGYIIGPVDWFLNLNLVLLRFYIFPKDFFQFSNLSLWFSCTSKLFVSIQAKNMFVCFCDYEHLTFCMIGENYSAQIL